jgi:hypothetical protein
MASDQMAFGLRASTVDPCSHEFLPKSRLNTTLRGLDTVPLRIVPA